MDEDALLMMGAEAGVGAFSSVSSSQHRHHYYILLKCERDESPQDYVQVGDCVRVQGVHIIDDDPFVLAREAALRPMGPSEELSSVPRALWKRVWESSVEDDSANLHYSGGVVRRLGPFTYQLDNSLRLHARLGCHGHHFPIGLSLVFYNLVCITEPSTMESSGGGESLVYCPHFSSLEGQSSGKTWAAGIGDGAVVDLVRLAECRTALQSQLRGIVSSSYLSNDDEGGKFMKFASRVMRAARRPASSDQQTFEQHFERDFSDHARHGRCSACVRSSFPFPLLSLATIIGDPERHISDSVRSLSGSVLAAVQFCPLSGRLMTFDATGSSFVLQMGQKVDDEQVEGMIVDPNSLVLCQGLRLATEGMPDALPLPRYLVVESMRVVSSLRSKSSGLPTPLAMAIADARGGGPPLSLFIIKYLHPPALLSSHGPMVVTVEGYTFGRLALRPASAGGSRVEMIQQTALSFQLPAAASASANLQAGEVLVVMTQPADGPVQFFRLEYECDPQISVSKEIRLLRSAGSELRMACSAEAFNYLTQSRTLLRGSAASGGAASGHLPSRARQVIPLMDMCVISREFQDPSELGLARTALRLSTRLFRDYFIGLPTRKCLVLYCRAESVVGLVIPPNVQMLYPLGLLPGARVRASGLAILPGTKATLPPLLAPAPHSTLQVLSLEAGPGLDKYPLRYLHELTRQTTTAFVSVIGQLVTPDEMGGMRKDRCLPPGEDRFRCQRCGLPIRQAECPSHGPLPASEWRPLRGLTLPFLDMTAAALVHIDPEMQVRLLRAGLLEYHRSGDALGPRSGVDLRLYCRFAPSAGGGGGRFWLEDYALIDYTEQCCQLLEVLESPCIHSPV